MATIVGQRSPLFYKKVAGGMPVILDTSKFTGNIFYVDSAVGTDGAGYGTTPDAPFDSIDYAIGKCTANQGDVILVLPGHSESPDAAGGITADIAGITIIGLGNGEDRPTITVGPTADAATFLVSAVDVAIKNLIFQPGNDGVDVLLDIDADGCIVEECEFRSDETNAYQADNYVDINGGGANAADRCVIKNCRFTSPTAGAAAAINIGAVEDSLRIEDNWIDGDWSNGGIYSASAFTNSLVARNIVANRAAATCAIRFTAAATGLLVDNRMYGNTLGTILDPGSMMCCGNLETDAIDQAGVDSPRTSAGGFADNSITAAVIANAAIDAATFAAGAIDAAAIANGAIDANTFAAGAINAAALADDAIDKAALADDALNLIQPVAATGETVIDEGDYDWTADYPALLTIEPAAATVLDDVVVYFDMGHAATGFSTNYAAQTINFCVERKVDGTNWRRDSAVLAAGLAGNASGSRLVKVEIGAVGPTEDVRVTAVLSAEVSGAAETDIPYLVYYKGSAAPTITPLTATA